MQVIARELWNDTGIDVAPGDRLRITASGKWDDWFEKTNAGGYERWHMAPFRFMRRCRPAKWFELVASVGKDGGEYHRIGHGAELTAARAGRLYLFANDARIAYWNNDGAIEAAIEQL
ncbi:hypothetical protein P1X14_07655 [Sphingomonas sp. AOB5]|uniref:hypothetical protein n=1 Tax=Sphingomonas sp. AOB5 TaxID=3034017 RepID=UPI0023F9BE3F|nr:hypothetical protein [Sphingomonas sp. AOB5]MDF7775117.1 hypothetical protein [Sphingomonas sp. AOB5]